MRQNFRTLAFRTAEKIHNLKHFRACFAQMTFTEALRLCHSFFRVKGNLADIRAAVIIPKNNKDCALDTPCSTLPIGIEAKYRANDPIDFWGTGRFQIVRGKKYYIVTLTRSRTEIELYTLVTNNEVCRLEVLLVVNKTSATS